MQSSKSFLRGFLRLYDQFLSEGNHKICIFGKFRIGPLVIQRKYTEEEDLAVARHAVNQIYFRNFDIFAGFLIMKDIMLETLTNVTFILHKYK